MNNHFELPGSFKKWTMGLIVAGVLALLYGFIMLHPFEQGGHGEHTNSTRFWAVLLQNSVYWLLTVNASMFFLCVTTMAMGGWQVALRRVPEAISSVLPILGLINFIILMCIVLILRPSNHQPRMVTAEAIVKNIEFRKPFLPSSILS